MEWSGVECHKLTPIDCRFVIFNKRDFFQKKPSLIQSEYSDLELGRLTVLCRRLKALIPSLGVPGGGSSGGRSDKNKKFQPTQQPLEFNDPAYNSKVLRPFVVSHFNEITMTHKQFVNQLLKILVLLRSGNIDFRVGEYSQTNNRNRNRDVAKFIPGESLRNCVTKFDDAVFVATLDDRRSCLNQQHAILKGGFLGGFVGELKRLEVSERSGAERNRENKKDDNPTPTPKLNNYLFIARRAGGRGNFRLRRQETGQGTRKCEVCLERNAD